MPPSTSSFWDFAARDLIPVVIPIVAAIVGALLTHALLRRRSKDDQPPGGPDKPLSPATPKDSIDLQNVEDVFRRYYEYPGRPVLVGFGCGLIALVFITLSTFYMAEQAMRGPYWIAAIVPVGCGLFLLWLVVMMMKSMLHDERERTSEFSNLRALIQDDLRRRHPPKVF